MRICKAIPLFIVFAPKMGGKLCQSGKFPVTPVGGYGIHYFKSSEETIKCNCISRTR